MRDRLKVIEECLWACSVCIIKTNDMPIYEQVHFLTNILAEENKRQSLTRKFSWQVVVWLSSNQILIVSRCSCCCVWSHLGWVYSYCSMPISFFWEEDIYVSLFHHCVFGNTFKIIFHSLTEEGKSALVESYLDSHYFMIYFISYQKFFTFLGSCISYFSTVVTNTT